MHEIVYKNAVLTPKQFGNAPLTLHNKPTGENAFYGYDTSDTNFLSQQWAKETGSYYFDLNDFMEAVHLGNTKKIEQYKKQLKDKKKIITSDLVLGTNKEQTGLAYNHWESLFTKLKDIWTDTSLDERRIVIPLSLTFGLGQHAAVACLNFKPKQETAEIIFMEQHAQKKGEAEYDAGFDYTKGIQLHAKAWTDVMKSENYGFLGIKSVNTFVNDKPICRRHDTCGVVASKVARQLLATDDPMKLAKSGIVITDEQVDTLHARNQKLEAKYGYFPIVAVKSKKER